MKFLESYDYIVRLENVERSVFCENCCTVLSGFLDASVQIFLMCNREQYSTVPSYIQESITDSAKTGAFLMFPLQCEAKAFGFISFVFHKNSDYFNANDALETIENIAKLIAMKLFLLEYIQKKNLLTLRPSHPVAAEVPMLNDLVLYYQPKVDLRTGEVIGVEALIRWPQSDGSVKLPADFLHSINENDMELPFGCWIMDEVCFQLEHWRQEKIDISVSINISLKLLNDQKFQWEIQNMFSKHPTIRPEQIEFEILETETLETLDDLGNRLRALKETLGIEFSLDDFRPAYTSLTHLKELPIDTIKIDKTFISGIETDENDRILIEGIVSLAEIMNRKVIAEGVETIEQGALLLALGCFCGQGYAIARPMPGEKLKDWCLQWSPPIEWSTFFVKNESEIKEECYEW